MAATLIRASEICAASCACSGQRSTTCLGALFRWLGSNATDCGSGQVASGSILPDHRGLLLKCKGSHKVGGAYDYYCKGGSSNEENPCREN